MKEHWHRNPAAAILDSGLCIGKCWNPCIYVKKLLYSLSVWPKLLKRNFRHKFNNAWEIFNNAYFRKNLELFVKTLINSILCSRVLQIIWSSSQNIHLVIFPTRGKSNYENSFSELGRTLFLTTTVTLSDTV